MTGYLKWSDMSRTLTISDELYERLESEARKRGVKTVEELLDRLQSPETDIALRENVVRQIDLLRERLFARYGQMPDSVELVREDRAR
jgi:predicted CopG family antitoxin